MPYDYDRRASDLDERELTQAPFYHATGILRDLVWLGESIKKDAAKAVADAEAGKRKGIPKTMERPVLRAEAAMKKVVAACDELLKIGEPYGI